jgi:hypothetical protein
VQRNPDERPLDDYGLEDEYEDDDPNDPRHRDHDLSTSADYGFDSWQDDKPWFLRRWVLLLVSGLLIFSLVLGLILPYV